MSLGARLLRKKGIGRFLYAVVHKPIGLIRADNQLQMESFPQFRFGLSFGHFKNSRKCCGFSTVSNAGKLLQCSLGRSWKPVELRNHEVQNIVGIALSMNSIQI